MRGLLRSLIWLMSAAILWLPTASVHAHKVNVFAFVEGEQLYVQGYFTDGKMAKNSQVTVYSADDQVLAEGVTNEEGEYTFDHRGAPGLRVVLNAGEGHLAEYLLGADELPSETGAPASAAGAGLEGIAAAELGPTVTRAVAQAIKPLAREIAELKERRSFSDIVGGVGFIVGLLGVFAYYKARKSAS